MKIAVIILSFNSEKYFSDLLESLEKTRWPEGEHEIIFIDNDSKDNSRKILKNYIEDKSSYKFIPQEKNLGFAGGNNVGMKYAIENKYDYVVLLNDDTVVDPNWIEEMLAVMQAKNDAGAVQSLLMHWDRKDLVNSWGNMIHFLGFQFTGGNLKVAREHSKEIRVKPVAYCSGAAVMYKVSVLKEVGLFDEKLESYHEDSEMSLNMRLAGYNSYLSPKSIVYHKYQFLGGRDSLNSGYKYYLMERNRLVFLLKYYSVKTLLLIFPAWFIMEAGTFAFSMVRGFWKEKIKAYWWCIVNMEEVLVKRNEIKAKKNISDKEFTKDFVGTISFQEINNPLLNLIGNPLMNFYWRLIRHMLY